MVQEEPLTEIIKRILIKMGINNFLSFRSASEAFEVTSRQQVDLLIVGIDLEDGPGITLLQRLKATGNYGFEPFLYIGKGISNRLLALLLEYDVEYVLTEPLNQARISEKLKYIINEENNVSDDLQKYRDAKSAFITGCYEMAEEMATEAKESGHFTDNIDILLGDIEAVNESYDKAKQHYIQVLSRKGKLVVAATHRLAKVMMAEGNFKKAKEILDAMVKQYPEHIKILENAGMSNYKLGHLELAEEQMSSLEKLDNSNRVAGEISANIKIDRGDFEGVATKMLNSHSEQEIISRLNLAGVALWKAKDFLGAIRIYKECLTVVKKKEYKGKIHYNLAIAFSQIDKAQQAISAAREAIKYTPSLEKAHDLLGRMLAKVS